MPFRLLLLALVAATLLLTGGCSKAPVSSIPRNPDVFAMPGAPRPIEVGAEYRLAPSDEVEVAFFQVPDMSRTATVDAVGAITLPLVGDVDVGGLTVRQVKTKVETLYGERYLQDPQIAVSVVKASNQRVTVDGAVNQAGVYPLSGDTTLLQALSMARGPRDDALLSRVVIFRRIDGERQAAMFDVDKIRTGELNDPTIYGNDVVVVDGSEVRRNLRDVIGSLPLLAIFNPFQ